MMAERVQPISNDPAGNMHRAARVALTGMMVNVVLAAAKIAACANTVRNTRWRFPANNAATTPERQYTPIAQSIMRPS